MEYLLALARERKTAIDGNAYFVHLVKQASLNKIGDENATGTHWTNLDAIVDDGAFLLKL